MLVDTSIWIDFFNGKKNAQSNRLRELINSDDVIFICPVIIQEILQGIKADSDYSSKGIIVKSRITNAGFY